MAKGMAALLLAQPESAYQLFSAANLVARLLPDCGRLRLAEAMASAYGMRTAAAMGGDPNSRDAAEAEYQAHAATPGREAEAQSYKAQIEQEFGLILRALHNQRHSDRGADPGRPEPTNAGGLVAYQAQLAARARAVSRGQQPFDEALGALLVSFGPGTLTARDIYFAAFGNHALILSDPQMATVFMELNFQVGESVRDPEIGRALAHSAAACGHAWQRHAVTMHDGRAGLQTAVRYLRRALLEAGRFPDFPPDWLARTYSMLGSCLMILGDLVEAEDALRVALDANKEPEGVESRQLLGTTLGNLAEVQGKAGEYDASLENYVAALRVFIDIRDFPSAQVALGHISRLSARIGRIDQAWQAYRETAKEAEDAANLPLAAECLISAAPWGLSIRKFEEALADLRRAEELLDRARDKDEAKSLQLRYAALMLAATYLIGAATHDQFGPEAFARGREELEGARGIAERLRDGIRVAGALLQLAVLHLEAMRYDEADRYIADTRQIALPKHLLALRNHIEGRLHTARGQYADAVRCFESALANYELPDVEMRRFWVYERLGMCHEVAGQLVEAAAAYEAGLNYYEERRALLSEMTRMDFAGNAEGVYNRLILLYAGPGRPTFDPWKALYWVEKSKSRVLLDVMRYSYVIAESQGEEARALRDQEQERLARLHEVRVLLANPQVDGHQWLALNREFQRVTEQLRLLWDRLRDLAPRYVEMRLGQELTWSSLQAMLA